jgi:hypothetical protein
MISVAAMGSAAQFAVVLVKPGGPCGPIVASLTTVPALVWTGRPGWLPGSPSPRSVAVMPFEHVELDLRYGMWTVIIDSAALLDPHAIDG